MNEPFLNAKFRTRDMPGEREWIEYGIAALGHEQVVAWLKKTNKMCRGI
jgi:hypothetical protein